MFEEILGIMLLLKDALEITDKNTTRLMGVNIGSDLILEEVEERIFKLMKKAYQEDKP